MAFGFEIRQKEKAPSVCNGDFWEIACQCWFTSQGRSIPMMIKLRDEDGTICTIREIAVHSAEEKQYAGILSIEYPSTIRYHGREMEVTLVFFKEECRWVMKRREPTFQEQG